MQDRFRNQNIGSFVSCLGIGVLTAQLVKTRARQESWCHKLNLSLFFSCSIQNPASDWFFKQEADWIIYLTCVVRGQLDLIFSFKDENKNKKDFKIKYNMNRY